MIRHAILLEILTSVIFSLGGQVNGQNNQKILLSSEGKNSSAIVEPSKLWEKPSQEKIRSSLSKLLEWDGSRNYFYFFFMMPDHEPLNRLYAGDIGHMSDKDRFVNPYDQTPIDQDKHQGPCIALNYVTQLKDLPDNNGICVRISGNGKLVPVNAAEIMASGFRHGFVTRIVLGEYIRAWNTRGANISIESLNFASKLNAQLQNENDINKFIDINSYRTPAPENKMQFEIGFAKLLRENNLHAVGLLYGWKAASEVEKLRGGADDRFYKSAVAFINTCYSPDKIGESTSYTLHYLLGYVRIVNERLNKSPLEPSAQNNDQILSRLGTDNDVGAAKKLLCTFCEVVLDEYHVLAANKQNNDSLKVYYLNFIKGYLAGSVKAADDIAVLGYQTGYQDGFKDGYSRGYADGYRDGYANGHAEAWKEANKVITALRLELERRNSIGGILEDIGKGIIKGILSIFGASVSTIPKNEL